MTIIKVAGTGKVFGGYTDITFQHLGIQKTKDRNSFIFYFKDGVAKKSQNKNSDEIYQSHQKWMPAFGWAFKVLSGCNVNSESYTFFDGDNYYWPEGSSDGYSA